MGLINDEDEAAKKSLLVEARDEVEGALLKISAAIGQMDAAYQNAHQGLNDWEMEDAFLFAVFIGRLNGVWDSLSAVQNLLASEVQGR